MSKRDIYRCPNCKKRYLRLGSKPYSCCVAHGPKDCCHAFEQRVTKKGWAIHETPMVVRPYPWPNVGTSSTTMAPWCSSCGGFHIPGAGACTGTYS